MKPFSKSVWMTPAASGFYVDTDHARDAFDHDCPLVHRPCPELDLNSGHLGKSPIGRVAMPLGDMSVQQIA